MKDEFRSIRERTSTRVPKAAGNHMFCISPEKAFAPNLVCNSDQPPIQLKLIYHVVI